MMCSARKRSFNNYEDDSSDNDFDYTVQKRLRTNCRKSDTKPNGKQQRDNPGTSKHTRKKQVLSSKSSKNCSISMTHSTENLTSTAIDYISLVKDDDGDNIVSENNLSSDQIIADILDDHSNDVSCDVKPQVLTSTSQSSIKSSVEVPSPKKQSSLLEFFKVQRNGVVLTKETSTSKNSSKSTNFKMYQSGSRGQMVFKKSNEPKNDSSYNTANRDCPFYKKIPGTTITVDAFQYGNIPGCNAYFLSHFHSDHYSGLTKHFQNPIYCSSATGNLVCKKLGVASQYVHKLALDNPTMIENVKVTLLDANHCPGSVMFLFVLTNGSIYLHTGDFRATQEMERIPILNRMHVDQLYLDTTYCSSAYNFPSQDEVISFVTHKAREAVDANPKTLIICGTYTIGKEKIFLAIAKLLGSKVFVSKDKKIILDCLESKDISDVLSTEESRSRIHILPMMKITLKGMNEYLKKYSHTFNSVLGFKPTGWTYSGSVCSLSNIKPQISGQVTIYGVPYSEHSSFSELKRFVQFIRPTKVIPTVFGGTGHRISDMKAIFKEWLRN